MFPIGYCINSVLSLLYSTPYSSLQYFGFSISTVILVNDGHLENADDSIVVTLDGIVIVFNDERPENAEYPIDVTLDGIVILINDVHE